MSMMSSSRQNCTASYRFLARQCPIGMAVVARDDATRKRRVDARVPADEKRCQVCGRLARARRGAR